MFEDSLMESGHRIKTKSKWWSIVALIINVAIVIGLVLWPLMHLGVAAEKHDGNTAGSATTTATAAATTAAAGAGEGPRADGRIRSRRRPRFRMRSSR